MTTKSRIYIVEGCTCSGKTSMVKSIASIIPVVTLLEHPPRLDDTSDWVAHQRNVFKEYFEAFWNSDGDFYADFSPLACIPFEQALSDVDLITPEDAQREIETMRTQCNRLCKRHSIYLHRFLWVDLETTLQRLEQRGRNGDDTWDVELLRALLIRYREFFENGLEMRQYRIVGVKPYGV